MPRKDGAPGSSPTIVVPRELLEGKPAALPENVIPHNRDAVLAEYIFSCMMDEGMSVQKICNNRLNLKKSSNITLWLAEKYPDQYRIARECRADWWADVLMDHSLIDYALLNDHKANALVQAHRLFCDNLKWHMSKMYPGRYGEKVMNENNNQLTVNVVNYLEKPRD